MNPVRIAVLASGEGTNLQKLIDAQRRSELGCAQIELVVSDRPKSRAIDRAREHSIASWAASPKSYEDKAAYESEIVRECERHAIDYVVLAGYMRLCGSTLLKSYGGRIINLHPSLLPAFSGRDAVEQALASGARFTGVTIHFVDEGMDTGPIIAQQVIPIDPFAEPDRLRAKVREAEHRMLPAVVKALADGAIRLEGRRVFVTTGVPIHGWWDYVQSGKEE